MGVNHNVNCVFSENDEENCPAIVLLSVTVSDIFPSLSTEVRQTKTNCHYIVVVFLLIFLM